MKKITRYFFITFISVIILFFIRIVFFNDKAVLKNEIKNIEYEINQNFCIEDQYIECTNQFYDKKSEKIELYFRFEEHNELEGMYIVAKYIANYINNNPKSFLYEKQVVLGSNCCNRLGDIKICNFDPETKKFFSEITQFNYGYFDSEFYNKESFSLSKLKEFNWFEIIEFKSNNIKDDYSFLLNFPQLREIRCNIYFLNKKEQKVLQSKNIKINFN